MTKTSDNDTCSIPPPCTVFNTIKDIVLLLFLCFVLGYIFKALLMMHQYKESFWQVMWRWEFWRWDANFFFFAIAFFFILYLLVVLLTLCVKSIRRCSGKDSLCSCICCCGNDEDEENYYPMQNNTEL